VILDFSRRGPPAWLIVLSWACAAGIWGALLLSCEQEDEPEIRACEVGVTLEMCGQGCVITECRGDLVWSAECVTFDACEANGWAAGCESCSPACLATLPGC